MDLRTAFGAFDLCAGFTSLELANLSHQGAFFSFVYLIACLWLTRALKYL
jgi:hypothetical protein